MFWDVCIQDRSYVYTQANASLSFGSSLGELLIGTLNLCRAHLVKDEISQTNYGS